MSDLIRIPRCEPARHALFIPDDLTITEWASAGRILRDSGDALMFWVGDWRNFGDEKLSSEHDEAVRYFIETEMRYMPETVRRAAYVCKKVPCVLRIPSLSFSHHGLVAPLKEPEQRKWLKMATEKDWTVQEMNAAMRAEGQDPNTKQINTTADHFMWENWLRMGEKGLKEQMRLNPIRVWEDDLLVMRINQIEELQKPLLQEAEKRNLPVCERVKQVEGV